MSPNEYTENSTSTQNTEESITIHNFAGIRKLKIDIKTINIIIGPQASGKSIILKLIYFFRSFFDKIEQGIIDGKSKRDIDRAHINLFIKYFPKDSWPESLFSINYQIGRATFLIKKEKNKKNIIFKYSTDVKNLITKFRQYYKKALEQRKNASPSHVRKLHILNDKYHELLKKYISDRAHYQQIFIPAGRSFFSNLQSSIFTFLASNESLDPFLIEFGSIYEQFKRLNPNLSQKDHAGIEKIINSIINSHYTREKGKDFLIHDDQRKVRLSNASSGQQEILPLLLVLKMFTSFRHKGTVLYIEEPEAHLFPFAQNKVVRILARIFNAHNEHFQFLITTHSPYILSSFNNLIYAGYLAKKLPENEQKKLYSIVAKEELLDYNDLFAFSITPNKIINAMNEKIKLIDQNLLDEISQTISKEFEELMELEDED